MNTHTPVALALCAGLVIAGCSKKTPSPAATADTATASATAVAAAPAMDPAAEAKKKFNRSAWSATARTARATARAPLR